MRRSPYDIDVMLGMPYYYLDFDWGPLGAQVPRPDGFRVVEEVAGVPCTEFRPSGSGNMHVYLLTKVGVDHATAMRLASRLLGSRPHVIGIKDSNAVTFQLAYTVGGSPRVREARQGGVELRYLGDHDRRVEHTGNRFSIRVVARRLDELARRVSALASAKRLPAYFGYQRFGLVRPNSHAVGRAIVRGDLREAVDLLLGRPFSSEPEAWREFRELYDRGMYREALEAAPRSLWPEARVLRELLRSGDPARAIRRYPMPPGFFVEAYQSYLFNLCLSRYLEANEVPERIAVPSSASRAEGACREVMNEEGVRELASSELGVRARDMVRESFMEVRGLGLSGEWLEFSLGRGMYATVVLRELLRQDPLTFAG
ncbi:tRNA pseudouridine(13) synthase TruD [Acidilobus sp.]|uniref:tRNA pseudouridine(13) synthase TruD n=1 Tax=Acidilobus sp. TaxID=1872109 RepID=UPI003CFF9150